MMSEELDLAQGTDEWLIARIGVITGTRAVELMSNSTTALMAQMVIEHVTADQAKENFRNKTMQRGIDTEPAALADYSLVKNVDVRRVGLVLAYGDRRLGVSPDGLVGDYGGVEAKCLEPHNHVKILLAGKPEKKYITQMEWGLFVTGRNWWDYHGYCKELQEPLTSWTWRLERDRDRMREMAEKALTFLDNLDKNLEKLGLAL